MLLRPNILGVKFLIDCQSELDQLCLELKKCPVIAVDAEMDSYYCYHTKLCLIQVSTLARHELIDPLANLDLSELGRVFADPKILKVAHAAENDIPYYRRATGANFVSLFDTHLAARVLEREKSGLAGLLQELMEVHLDKQHQTADWRVRPLPADLVEYALNDTRYLLPLWEILQLELQEKSLLEIAEFRFRQACLAELPVRKPNPFGWKKIAGAKQLPADVKIALHALYGWRESLAEKLDLPLFRVAPDGHLVQCSLHLSKGNLETVRKHNNPKIRAASEEILDLVQAARQSPNCIDSGPPPQNPLSRDQERVFRAVRDWRNQENLAVLTNRRLTDLVKAAPKNWEQFRGLDLLPEEMYNSCGSQLWEVYRVAQR